MALPRKVSAVHFMMTLDAPLYSWACNPTMIVNTRQRSKCPGTVGGGSNTLTFARQGGK